MSNEISAYFIAIFVVGGNRIAKMVTAHFLKCERQEKGPVFPVEW